MSGCARPGGRRIPRRPEYGVSAIDKLLDALMQLRAIELPGDPDLGRTYYSIGLIEGGVAPNVISPHASAEVMFRTIGPPEALLALLERLKPLVEFEEVLRVPHVRLKTWPANPVETAVFPFTTDIPLLSAWGTPLLFGPGSFLVAHTSEEHLHLAELERRSGTMWQLAGSCLREATEVTEDRISKTEATEVRRERRTISFLCHLRSLLAPLDPSSVTSVASP